ncbi:hypothetical protein A9Q84_02005 [Halobacteriovorax marinus]|uniref:Lipoprotein n=1 Tax=Halobacteriovorax marinus TaxID=97084 RepID=A0A1Y5FI05_9BACT|nr:hypothetical protein A9Q84_02005 [Halobacteriovorax marinus]
MQKMLILFMGLILISCGSDNSGGNLKNPGFVINVEDINKMREDLSAAWENWRPASRNVTDEVIHASGELTESHSDDGPKCHYVYENILYTTVWNTDIEDFDLDREFINYYLGSDSTEDPAVCHLRANTGSAGDAFGLKFSALIFLYLDQLDSDSPKNAPIFDEIKVISMRKGEVRGIKTWELSYSIKGKVSDSAYILPRKLKENKRDLTYSGTLSVTFASEVPFTAWLLKSAVEVHLSDGTGFGENDLFVESINNVIIK